MHFRWSNNQEYQLRFEAEDADDLAGAAIDAAITARLETAKHYHEGGEGVDRVKYPSLYLHIGCEVCGNWHRCGRMNCNRAGIPHRDVVEGAGEPDPQGLDDATIIRSRAARWWRHGTDWIEHCRNLQGMGESVGDIIKGRDHE